MADKLYIYDSIKAGLLPTNIKTEIIKYHTQIKNISTDNITPKTINLYLDFMTDLIENNGISKYIESFTT